jgi:hypothetical protein
MTNNKLHHSKSYLKKRYIVDKKTPQQIAQECGVSIQIIYKQLKKFNLK